MTNAWQKTLIPVLGIAFLVPSISSAQEEGPRVTDCTGQADGTPCDDGDLCTANGHCETDLCVSIPLPEGTPCEELTDACVPPRGGVDPDPPGGGPPDGLPPEITCAASSHGGRSVPVALLLVGLGLGLFYRRRDITRKW